MKKLLQLIEWVQTRSTAGKIGLGLVALITYSVIHGVLVNAGLVERTIAPAQTATVEAPAVETPPYPESIVRPYLRANLHDWDSYEGEGYSEPVKTTYKGKEAYQVVHKYRAKNGFGAMRLTTQVFYYTQDRELLGVETM